MTDDLLPTERRRFPPGVIPGLVAAIFIAGMLAGWWIAWATR